MRILKIAVVAAAFAISALCIGIGTYNQNYAQNTGISKHRSV